MPSNANCRIVPPIGVYAVAGCGADLLINICLTLLGYVLLPCTTLAVSILHALRILTNITTATFQVISTPSTSNMSTTIVRSKPVKAASQRLVLLESTASVCKAVVRDTERSLSLSTEEHEVAIYRLFGCDAWTT